MSIYKEFEKLVEKRKILCEKINYESDHIIKEMVSLMTSNVIPVLGCSLWLNIALSEA